MPAKLVVTLFVMLLCASFAFGQEDVNEKRKEVQKELEQLRGSVEALEARVQALEAIISKISENEERYLELVGMRMEYERDLARMEEALASVKTRHEKSLFFPKVEILQRASLPTQPSTTPVPDASGETRYEATARVAREGPEMSEPPLESKPSEYLPTISLNALRAEVLSWPILDKVIRKLKLDGNLHTPDAWQDMLEKIGKNIRIRYVSRGSHTAVLSITATDSDAKSAQELANAIADAYAEWAKKARENQMHMATESIRKHVEDSRKKLSAVNAEMKKHRGQVRN